MTERSEYVSSFAVLAEMDPPKTLKKHKEIQWFGEGARKGATFHQNVTFGAPGGVFFGDFHGKTHNFPTFHPVW